MATVPIRRDVVAVSGPEAVAFLQGQLSQDVAALAVGDSAWSLLLQPTGKVDAWLRVTRTGEDALLLDVDEGAGEAVLARLRRFKLRTKVDLEAGTWSGWAVRGPSALVPDVVEDGVVLEARWPGTGGVDVLGPTTAPLPEAIEQADPDVLEAARIEAGVPAMGAEITDATIPAELGQWLIDASVSFTKGCYTGQELVARIDSRGGKVPRPLRGLVVEGAVPEVGAVVRSGGDEIGRVTSSAASARFGSVALALLPRAIEPGAPVAVDTASGPVSAEVRELPLG